MKADADRIKKEIMDKVAEYYEATKKDVAMGRVPVSGKVFDEKELKNLVDASLRGWWTDGEYVDRFESKLSAFLGLKYAVSCNSGSSANLLAFASLTSHLIDEKKRIKAGDEVMTVAATFPTTVNPILLYGCVPVFVDVELGTYDAQPASIESAITKKTKAIFLAHTLGNPFKAKEIREIADKNGLWLIEDNCDSLGSKYGGKYTGTFGHLSTLSFYPAHHITTAEGGAVLTNDPLLDKILRSMRDWGRDCWCKTGRDNTCGKRFTGRFGELPTGYDHKYVYSHTGYNLKMTDLQAAIGVAQMDKLPGFIKKRKENFKSLYNALAGCDDYFILPEATEGSEPSWFGFPLSAIPGKVKREELIAFLEKRMISTRLLFAGNMTKQPCFVDGKVKYRTAGDLKNTDYVMNNTFWIGVYPGIGNKQTDYAASVIKEFVGKKG